MGDRFRVEIALAITGLVLLLPFLGATPLLDWDEINFAEIAREMLVTGNFLQIQVDYIPFGDKPPLLFWLQAICFKLFGVSAFSARFPNALVGILTWIVVYRVGRKLFSERLGRLWALAYVGSFLPFFYFRSGIIDPLFNLFIFSGIFMLSRFYEQKAWRSLLFAGMFIGLAMLTKGPVALFVTTLVWGGYWLWNRAQERFPIREYLVFLGGVLLFPFCWLAVESVMHGGFFLAQFAEYHYRLLTSHDAGFKGFPGYHFVVLLLGCFPASIFALTSFHLRGEADGERKRFKQWMFILFAVVLAAFSIVRTKVMHYSSLTYFPITFFAAYALDRMISGDGILRRYQKVLFGLVAAIFAAAFVALPWFFQNPETVDRWMPWATRDEFTRAILAVQGGWLGIEPGLGLLYLAICVWALRLISQGRILRGARVAFVGTALSLFVLMSSILPRIERHLQGPVLDFYRAQKGQRIYLEPWGFKTFAHLFYTERMPDESPEAVEKKKNGQFRDWILKEPVDRPVYIVTRVTSARQFIEQYPGFERVPMEGGFAIFRKRE